MRRGLCSKEGHRNIEISQSQFGTRDPNTGRNSYCTLSTLPACQAKPGIGMCPLSAAILFANPARPDKCSLEPASQTSVTGGMWKELWHG